MMGDELALLSRARTIDAVGLEDDDGEIAAHRHNHQWQEEAVAARQFGDEEDACQRSVHHPRHHPGHAHEGEILFGHMNAQFVDVPQARKEEPAEAADEKRGGKGSATAATAIGGRRGKHFR